MGLDHRADHNHNPGMRSKHWVGGLQDCKGLLVAPLRGVTGLCGAMSRGAKCRQLRHTSKRCNASCVYREVAGTTIKARMCKAGLISPEFYLANEQVTSE